MNARRPRLDPRRRPPPARAGAPQQMLGARFDVVGVAYDGEELLDLLQHHARPTASSSTSPSRAGAASNSCPTSARIQPDLRVLVLTMHVDRILAEASLAAGALGFVPKDSGMEELETALTRGARRAPLPLAARPQDLAPDGARRGAPQPLPPHAPAAGDPAPARPGEVLGRDRRPTSASPPAPSPGTGRTSARCSAWPTSGSWPASPSWCTSRPATRRTPAPLPRLARPGWARPGLPGSATGRRRGRGGLATGGRPSFVQGTQRAPAAAGLGEAAHRRRAVEQSLQGEARADDDVSAAVHPPASCVLAARSVAPTNRARAGGDGVEDGQRIAPRAGERAQPLVPCRRPVHQHEAAARACRPGRHRVRATRGRDGVSSRVPRRGVSHLP